jgi:hypothetical protein
VKVYHGRQTSLSDLQAAAMFHRHQMLVNCESRERKVPSEDLTGKLCGEHHLMIACRVNHGCKVGHPTINQNTPLAFSEFPADLFEEKKESVAPWCPPQWLSAENFPTTVVVNIVVTMESSPPPSPGHK